jgi:hypothetical protein
MKNKILILGATLFASFIFSSCGNNQENKQTQTTENNQENKQTQTTEVEKNKQVLLQPEYLGIYHGIQPSYYLKNQFGDDMLINGQKVSVSSSDFKFLLKEDGAVSLQQTNLEDNSRYYYDGKIKIIKDATDILKIECSLSDGKSSNPTYTLTINKSDKTAICIGHKEPEFKLEKK